MKPFGILFFAVLLSGCVTGGAPKLGAPLTDGLGFGFDNCAIPNGSYAQNGGTIVFRLADKDYGGCSSDRAARNSAPYWERVELTQTGRSLPDGVYEFSYDLRIDGGFSMRTTIFQIHTFTSNCVNCKPIFMQKINADGIIGTNGGTRERVEDPRIELGRFYNFRWVFNIVKAGPDGFTKVKLHLDDKFIREFDAFWGGRGSPHIKFGMYRPGHRDNPNPTATHTVKNISFARLQ